MATSVSGSKNRDAKHARPKVEAATADEVKELENLIASARPKMTTMSHDDTSDFLDKLLNGEFGEVAMPAPTQAHKGVRPAGTATPRSLSVPSGENKFKRARRSVTVA